jgi:hypothetical protein
MAVGFGAADDTGEFVLVFGDGDEITVRGVGVVEVEEVVADGFGTDPHQGWGQVSGEAEFGGCFFTGGAFGAAFFDEFLLDLGGDEADLVAEFVLGLGRVGEELDSDPHQGWGQAAGEAEGGDGEGAEDGGPHPGWGQAMSLRSVRFWPARTRRWM